VAGIAAAALVQEVRWRVVAVRRWRQRSGGSSAAVVAAWRWQYCGGGSMAAAATAQQWWQQKKRSGQCGASATAAEGAPAAKAAEWPQPWGRWQQAWHQHGIGGGGSTVRVRVRSYSIFNMCDILIR
jgi:hypothetical protein